MNVSTTKPPIIRAKIYLRFKPGAMIEAIVRNTPIVFFRTEMKYKGATMNRATIYRSILIALAVFYVVLPAAAGQSSSKSGANPVTITGQVSCSKFYGPVIPRKGFTIAETVHLCISQGYTYTIVSGKNIYPLVGDKKELAKLAGETVTVNGHQNPDMPVGATYALMDPVQADAIAPAKN
jgi:hypothetical protein